MNAKKDFPMLQNDSIIYFDNAATTFKPNKVIESMNEYYETYTANSHRGDYNISFKVDDEYDSTRETIQQYINAKQKQEIIFTYGTTDSVNMVVNGYFKNILKPNDEILLNKAEHASNILPWLILSKEIGIKIKYIPLTKENKLTLENIKSVISKKTKVISLAHITNVVGDKRDINEICKLAKKYNIYTVIDAAQSIGHTKIDVQDIDCDFLAFSAHKMCGPTGIGVLYGKYDLLVDMLPTRYGGGMNKDFDEEKLTMSPIPYRFEGGTHNLSAIISFKEAIKYINDIGIENIERSEKYLRKYLINELEKINYVKIFNKESDSGIVLINVDNVFSGDLGLYLNTKGICVRSGKHCVKMLKDESDFDDTVRISLYFYNTYEEIDKLINALSDYEAIKEFTKNA